MLTHEEFTVLNDHQRAERPKKTSKKEKCDICQELCDIPIKNSWKMFKTNSLNK